MLHFSCQTVSCCVLLLLLFLLTSKPNLRLFCFMKCSHCNAFNCSLLCDYIKKMLKSSFQYDFETCFQQHDTQIFVKVIRCIRSSIHFTIVYIYALKALKTLKSIVKHSAVITVRFAVVHMQPTHCYNSFDSAFRYNYKLETRD